MFVAVLTLKASRYEWMGSGRCAKPKWRFQFKAQVGHTVCGFLQGLQHYFAHATSPRPGVEILVVEHPGPERVHSAE